MIIKAKRTVFTPPYLDERPLKEMLKRECLKDIECCLLTNGFEPIEAQRILESGKFIIQVKRF